MDRQYSENGARNIYQNKNQMRAYVECSLNQSKKIIPYRPFHREIDEASVSEFYQSIADQLYQATLIRWLSLLYVYK